MTHTHAKDQGLRSLSLKVRVEIDERTDGRTDRDDCLRPLSHWKLISKLMSKFM